MRQLIKPKNASSGGKRGQSLADYGLLLALVAVVAISGLGMLGDSVKKQLLGLAGTVSQVNTGSTAQNGCSGSGCATNQNKGF